MLVLDNATILTPSERLDQHRILIEDGRILKLGPAAQVDAPSGARVVDSSGWTAVPGFMDLQLNGGFGHDFTTRPEALWPVAEKLPRYGVTSFLPTIISSPPAKVAAAREVLAAGPPEGWHGALPLGLHVEGPFLNPSKKGAHNPRHLRPPSVEAVAGWSPEGGVRLVTLAPELPGALPVIETLAERGVVVGAGHSTATWEEAWSGFDAGVGYGTHLFNAMPPLGHREPGLTGALLTHPDLTVGLITDGVHVHPAMVDLAWRCKGGDRVNLVTDAIAALGMPIGRHVLGDQVVVVSDEDSRLEDNTLAGSVVPLDTALRNLMSFTGCSLAEALPAVTSTPARLLGLSDRGLVAPGARADLVLLTEAATVAMTIVGGKVVYSKR